MAARTVAACPRLTPGSRAASETNSVSIRAENATAAFNCCSIRASGPTALTGDSWMATKSRPMRAPATWPPAMKKSR